MLDVMTRAVEVRVSGEVQGVSFRGYAARKAVEFELVGWVRNEPDGSVLGHFEGPAAAVDSMVAWCREGSPSADVDGVDVRDVPATGASEFSVEY
jgi:acylphosphatase